MIVLAIDTATRRAAVAVGTPQGLLGEVALGGAGADGPPRHTEQLTPAIAYLCRETRIELPAVDVIAVSVGPGMFTGLRVGVVTAKALAHALAVPVVTVPSLDLVAWPLRHAHKHVVPLIDARRHEVYWARYRPVPGGVQREAGPALATPADVLGELAASGEPALLCGDGALRFASELEGDDDRVELAGPVHAAPSMAALVELACARAARGEVGGPADIVPIYLRRTDAEMAQEASA